MTHFVAFLLGCIVGVASFVAFLVYEDLRESGDI